VPNGRIVALAIAVGIGVGLYFQLWFRWPTFLAVAAGAVMAIVLLLVAASLGEDRAVADAAWREAAPDLVATPAGPDEDATEAEKRP
jgi:membrane protein YdbS with pleckstrin-like domain